VFTAALIVAIVTGIYVTSGGQTAVIMTDLLQGVILLVAGLAIFVLGFLFLGDGEVVQGASRFWEGLPEDHRYGLADFNGSTKFSFIGVFWQDAVASTFAAYFFNQGILMRFLSLKSVHEGRKAMCVALAVLLPIAVIAVGNAGWLGAAIYNLGMAPEGYPTEPDPNNIFVIVTHMVTRVLEIPGVFGLIMAALLAALMSTADTLINATSAVVVNDIWRPYIKKGRSDRYYLKVARYASIVAAILGLALVPVFSQFNSIYVAHGAFIALVTPPTMVTIMLGFLWPRYTAKAAFWTMLGGAIAMGLSVKFPVLIAPFSHGVDPSGGFKYMRAFYGIVMSGIIAVVVTYCTRPSKSDQALLGLTIWTVRDAMWKFKGGEANTEPGGKVRAQLRVAESDATESDEIALSLHPDDLETLKARPGDLIYLADRRWWLGGLRAAHARVRDDAGEKGVVVLSPAQIEANSLLVKHDVIIEKLL
jgi:SSS family solute:Na+ symporter